MSTTYIAEELKDCAAHQDVWKLKRITARSRTHSPGSWMLNNRAVKNSHINPLWRSSWLGVRQCKTVECCRRKRLPSRTNQLHPCQGHGAALHHPTEAAPPHRRARLWLRSARRPGMCGTAWAHKLSVYSSLLARQRGWNKGLRRSASLKLMRHVTHVWLRRQFCPMTLSELDSLQDSHIPLRVETQTISITSSQRCSNWQDPLRGFLEWR